MRVVRMVLLAAMVALASAPMVLGADMANQANRELQTALTHAGLAARQDSAAQIELHLHHVVNCIEGKSGKNYFEASSDVCQGIKGNGLLADLKDSGMAGAHALPYAEIANQVALWGLTSSKAGSTRGTRHPEAGMALSRHLTHIHRHPLRVRLGGRRGCDDDRRRVDGEVS